MFRARPFKCLLLIAVIIVGIAGMLYFAVPIEGSAIDKWWRPITLIISVMLGVTALGSLISMVHWFFDARFQTMTITDERTIWVRGIFERETSEVQHDDVRNIQVKQTFVDRILGVGRIAISSAGQDELEIDVRDVSPRRSQRRSRLPSRTLSYGYSARVPAPFLLIRTYQPVGQPVDSPERSDSFPQMY